MKTGFGVIGGTLAVIIVLVLVTALSALGYIAYQNVFGTRIQNADTNVTRQSNQYVTTQQQRELTLIAEYNRSDNDGQRSAIVDQVQQTDSTLPEGRRLPQVETFLASHAGGTR